MAASPSFVGSVGEFKQDAESITAYLERVNVFLRDNEIPEAKHVPVFLSLIGASTVNV